MELEAVMVTVVLSNGDGTFYNTTASGYKGHIAIDTVFLSIPQWQCIDGR